MKKKVFSFLSVILLGLLLVACGKTFEVKFDPDGGSPQAETKVVKKGELVTKPDNPTKEGYIFLYWKEYTATEAWDFENNVVEKDMTLYAFWEEDNEVVVAFEGEGISLSPVTLEKGKKLTVETPKRTGFVFAGWKVKGTENLWKLNDPVNKSMTLVAVWEEDLSVKVSFKSDGENLFVRILEKGDIVDKPEDPIKEGYVFAEWVAEGEQEPYDFTKKLTGDLVLVAVYREPVIDDAVAFIGDEWYLTLDLALAAAKDNDEIRVIAGTYSNEVVITNDNIKLIGPNEGIKADKDSKGRKAEAEFTNRIIISGTEGVVIDGIKLSGKAQIYSTGGVKDVLIQNVLAASTSVDAAEGIVFFKSATDEILNEDITIKDSSFLSVVNKLSAARLIRVNNPKNLYIIGNYLFSSFDAIRLESEGNAAMGHGNGVRGELLIKDNVFEDSAQYPIWIGAVQSAQIDIIDNYIGVVEGSGEVFGYLYIFIASNQVTKTTINVLNNEFPYAIDDWHKVRFNSNGATAEKLEINVNENIFHQAPGLWGENNIERYYIIADHFGEPAADFKINGTNNYYLFDEELLLESSFLNTIYEPYKTKIKEYAVYIGDKGYDSLADALADVEDNDVIRVTAGTYSDEVVINKDNVKLIGPNEGIKADKVSENRKPEAEFTNRIVISGTKGVVIDGIKLSGKAQIYSTGGVKDVVIQNVLAASTSVDSAQGIIFFSSSANNILNEDISIKDSSLISVNSKESAPRLIRINNPKNLYITDNYLFSSYDAIRLESEGNAKMGDGNGVRGELLIKDNVFEDTAQYPIWIGSVQSAKIDIVNNIIGVEEGGAGVFGYTYISVASNQETKTTINVLNNEFPYAVDDWHEMRFSSNGVAAEKLEINVNENIFHQAPGEWGGANPPRYYIIADHFATPAVDFKINGTNNYFLFDEELLLESSFLNTTYKPYKTEITND